MSKIKEAIELLENEGQWSDNVGRVYALVRWKNYIKTLALLRPLAEPECATCNDSKEVWDTQEFGARETGDKIPCPDCKDKLEASEFTKRWSLAACSEGYAKDCNLFKEASKTIDTQTAEIKQKDEKFNLLANHVIDMSHAIIGWREKLSFNSEDDVISELERMVEEALSKAKEMLEGKWYGPKE